MEVQEEKRPNIESLERKRDEYLQKAIEELEKKDPKNFKKENIDFLVVDITGLLMKKHGVDPDALLSSPHSPDEQRKEDKALEFYDTYTEKHIQKMLENYFSEKTK